VPSTHWTSKWRATQRSVREPTRNRLASVQAPYCFVQRATCVALRFASSPWRHRVISRKGPANRPFLSGLRRGPSNSAGARRHGFARYRSRNPAVKRRRDLAVFRVLLHQRVRSSPVSPGLADTLMALCSFRADTYKPVWLNGSGEHCFQCRRAPDDPRDVANTPSPKTMVALRLQGTTSLYPDLLFSHAGQPSWSFRPSSSTPVRKQKQTRGGHLPKSIG
jgi:hypothetical protein